MLLVFLSKWKGMGLLFVLYDSLSAENLFNEEKCQTLVTLQEPTLILCLIFPGLLWFIDSWSTTATKEASA